MSVLDLFGTPTPVSSMPAAYFALRPEPEIACAVEKLARIAIDGLAGQGRVLSARRLHVSLCPVGAARPRDEGTWRPP